MTNPHTVKLLETIRDMNTTALIAAELDRVIKEVGNLAPNDSREIVAAVMIAQLQSGKGKIIPVDDPVEH